MRRIKNNNKNKKHKKYAMSELFSRSERNERGRVKVRGDAIIAIATTLASSVTGQNKRLRQRTRARSVRPRAKRWPQISEQTKKAKNEKRKFKTKRYENQQKTQNKAKRTETKTRSHFGFRLSRSKAADKGGHNRKAIINK